MGDLFSIFSVSAKVDELAAARRVTRNLAGGGFHPVDTMTLIDRDPTEGYFDQVGDSGYRSVALLWGEEPLNDLVEYAGFEAYYRNLEFDVSFSIQYLRGVDSTTTILDIDESNFRRLSAPKNLQMFIWVVATGAKSFPFVVGFGDFDIQSDPMDQASVVKCLVHGYEDRNRPSMVGVADTSFIASNAILSAEQSPWFSEYRTEEVAVLIRNPRRSWSQQSV